MYTAADLSPQFRFVSSSPTAISTKAPLQMVRRVDKGGAFSWRAPKAHATLMDVQDFAHAHGGDLKSVSITAYKGGYRHTLVVG